MRKDIIVALAVYGGSLAAACLLWQTPRILLTGYVLVSAIVLYRWHSRLDLAAYGAALTLGTLTEIVAVSAGVWHYTAAYHVIPVWLPPGWGIMGLVLKRVSEVLTEVSTPHV